MPNCRMSRQPDIRATQCPRARRLPGSIYPWPSTPHASHIEYVVGLTNVTTARTCAPQRASNSRILVSDVIFQTHKDHDHCNNSCYRGHLRKRDKSRKLRSPICKMHRHANTVHVWEIVIIRVQRCYEGVPCNNRCYNGRCLCVLN